VSTVPEQAMRALQIVLAEFAQEPFHFKCLRDKRLVVAATSRWWQPGQVGKVIAIYPTSADECRAMLDRLAPALDGIQGPYVLTDRRYGDAGCLYYRYGEFLQQSSIEPDGTRRSVLRGPDGTEWTDDRAPVYRKPPWVDDLFVEPDAAPASRTINGYQVLRALHHTGTGGVYLAERLSDGATVVIKESRPHTAFAPDGSDGQVRLRREFETLTRLSGSGVGPEPIELFQAWEHLFLVQEHIDFGPLATFLAARNPLAHGDMSSESLRQYRIEAHTVLTNLKAAIATCHERGICYGDVSSTNVLVSPDSLAVRLVDFESARPLDEWAGDTPASPGFRPPEGSAALTDARRFDEFGVASVELTLISPRNVLRELSPSAMSQSTRHAAAVLQYPLGDLLQRLELPPADPTGSTDIDTLIKDVVRFVEATMTPDRADRVFPASADVFISSPWSVAFGVAGVIRGLHWLTDQVPAPVSEWMDTHAPSLDRMAAGLYFGQAGVGWTLLDIGEAERGLDLIDRAGRATLSDLPANVAEGTAGIGMASLAAWRRGGDGRGLDVARRVGDHLLRTARDPGLGLHWPVPGEKAEPLGYAYGSSGVATFLLYLYHATGERRFQYAGRRALDYELTQLQPREGGGLGLPGFADRPMLEPYWERGSAGFGGALARFCRSTGDERLRATLEKLVRSTLRGSAINPGLFTGMAGIVNFALDCRYLLHGSDYHELAAEMAQGIVSLACPQPEGIAFPGHGLLRYSNDFGTGSIGAALVLNRLHHGGPDFNYTLDELLTDGSDG
jgi:tRNA A-37 threonylcarbamoyl transferase component Bud32